MGIAAYIDFSILENLASSPQDTGKKPPHWQSMRSIWRKFVDNEITLVTSGMDLEIDIILWLNSNGCCITDTMRAMEAIDEFERWGMVEQESLKKWRRILIYYEQIDFLPDITVKSRDEIEEGLAALIKNEILDFRKSEPLLSISDEDLSILKDCAASLHLWYTDAPWKDLKRTDYQLNWEIFVSVLEQHGIKPIFSGAEGDKNRNLFGLWNRIVGLSKKSSGKLPMETSHADFVITTVLKKYISNRTDRDAVHILNCMKHGIGLYMTTNDRLIDAFNDKKHIYLQDPAYSGIKMNMVSPSGLEIKLSYK